MYFDYNKLFKKIKESGMTQAQFKSLNIISGSTFTHMRKNESVTTASILSLCEYFQCTPSDIMEFHL